MGLIVACGASSPAGESGATESQPPTQAPQVAKPTALAIPPTVASAPAPKDSGSAPPTVAAAPTAVPPAPVSARDTVIIFTGEEPTTIGAASANCGGNIQNTICDDMASDPLTWIDSNTFQVVPLSGIEGWEQTAPDTWRFTVRRGVEFHNGEPMTADALKLGMDIAGDPTHDGAASFHGPLHAEVIDEFTADVICDDPCPILPRQAIFNNVQAPQWWASATEDEKTRITVGIGPYRVIEWRSGVEVELEAYENYKPNDAFDAQMPTIQHMFQVWRGEALVRAAMISTEEADWAADIGFEQRDRVPKFASGTNNEVYIYVLDTIWHPELRKLKVRKALNLATDCEALMEALYDGLQKCFGNISAVGTVGITPENSAGYPYDPVMSKQLLDEAGYDPDNEIIIFARANRVYRDVELNEAVVNFWRAVGVNANLQVVESSIHGATGRSNCGHGRTREDFANAEGANLHEKCRNLGPGEPNFSSMHLTGPATSTESLDYSRQAILRNSCYSRSSRVCFEDLEEMIAQANATPTGDDRRQRMEAIANRVHDNFHFVPNFLVVSIYGLSEDLEWEPHYAPRIRANTMTFSQ